MSKKITDTKTEVVADIKVGNTTEQDKVIRRRDKKRALQGGGVFSFMERFLDKDRYCYYWGIEGSRQWWSFFDIGYEIAPEQAEMERQTLKDSFVDSNGNTVAQTSKMGSHSKIIADNTGKRYVLLRITKEEWEENKAIEREDITATQETMNRNVKVDGVSSFAISHTRTRE